MESYVPNLYLILLESSFEVELPMSFMPHFPLKFSVKFMGRFPLWEIKYNDTLQPCWSRKDEQQWRSISFNFSFHVSIKLQNIIPWPGFEEASLPFL